MLLSLFGVLVVFIAKRAHSIGNICIIEFANTVLLDDQLFFMSGNYSILSEDGYDFTPTGSLYWLNTNNQFPIDQSLSNSSLYNQSIGSSNSLAYSNAMYGSAPGAMWNTNDTIYFFGSASTPTNSLAAYNTTTYTWSEVSDAGGDFNFDNRSTAMFVSVPYSGLNFIFGGHDPDFVRGMVRFDASDPDNLSWTNETLGNGSYGVDVPNLSGAGLVNIPVGTEGILVAFGGYNSSDGINPDWGWPYYSDFSIIYLYDIASHTWFTQEASGDIPDSICQFCTVVTASPDYGAFHITIYGGWSLIYQRAYETVYVLDIPSFQWINVTQATSQSNEEQLIDHDGGRHGFSCQLYNDAVMVSVGGAITSGSYTIKECNDTSKPIRALDLSTYAWQTSLDPNVTYEVPSVIYNVIGGNSTGNATATAPQGGFSDHTLASIMKERVPRATNTKTSTSSTTPALPTGTGSPNHSSNVGAIAGGVVGGVVGLALIIGAIWFFFLRRHSSGQIDQARATELDSATFGELHGNARSHEADVRHVYEVGDTQMPVELAALIPEDKK